MDQNLLQKVYEDHERMLATLASDAKSRSVELARHIQDITHLLQSLHQQVTNLNRRVTNLQEDVEGLKAKMPKCRFDPSTGMVPLTTELEKTM
jgi:peptidoglycan hydrolase CwlO-like protein